MSVCQYECVSVRVCVSMSVCQYVCVSMSVCQYVCVSVCGNHVMAYQFLFLDDAGELGVWDPGIQFTLK